MIRTIKTKQFKITAFVLALVLTVSALTWNATRVHAQELTLDNTNVQTFAGARVIEDGMLVGTATEPATMSVFVTGGSLDKYVTNNMKWEHRGAGWQSPMAAPVFFAGENSVQQIYACSPYFENSTGSITVTASEQTDWLVATATRLTSSEVNLTMTHALAKLVIKPTFGTEVTTQTITSIEVGGMYASGNLKISDNTWSNLPAADATLEMKNNELLVIPMENCTSFDVVIKVEDGRVFTTTVSLEGVNNQLAAGTQYNINLQVGQDVVTLGNITAEPWGNPVNGGNLETE